ncbi:MAG: hypothetical protein WBY28_05360 [Nitrososphaeraceae archaeon]
MNKSNGVLIAILSAIVLMTIGITATPVLAGGSHDPHNHNNNKHCEKNGDNNCNTDNVDQEVYARNECEIENENDDHSQDNTNENTLSCVNNVQNINNALLGIVP